MLKFDLAPDQTNACFYSHRLKSSTDLVNYSFSYRIDGSQNFLAGDLQNQGSVQGGLSLVCKGKIRFSSKSGLGPSDL